MYSILFNVLKTEKTATYTGVYADAPTGRMKNQNSPTVMRFDRIRSFLRTKRPH